MAKLNAKMILGVHWDDVFPINAFLIAKNIGVQVKYFPDEFKNQCAGKYTKDENGKPVIYINDNHSSSQQNFTVAYEIGHHVLNSELTSMNTDCTFIPKNSQEKDAYIFAINLLMPDKHVTTVVELISAKSTDVMADIFNVPLPAVLLKMKELGYEQKKQQYYQNNIFDILAS